MAEEMRVPPELWYLMEPPARPHKADRPSELGGVSAVASRSLLRLIEAESEGRVESMVLPWLNDQNVPRFVISGYYAGTDSFGASRLLADIDLTARRVGYLSRQLGRNVGEIEIDAQRTSETGVRILDVRPGSLDVVFTVWGSLVAVAASTPVSVASLFALAWDLTHGATSVVKWAIRTDRNSFADRPSATAPANSQLVSDASIAEIVPALEAAVAAGNGVDFHIQDGPRSIRLTVPPPKR